MNQTEFLTALDAVSSRFNWVYSDNRLVGTGRRGAARGVTVNPVTAVALASGLGTFPNTKRGTVRAARQLGMSQELALAIYSQSNRGHAQIVRGKMLDTVFN
ncbi:MAG: hypothetical protein NWE83_07455 [Candidatus Bathyarchaeota archaeon]|nr:hypothetical protein [Candidatus Bathyarchaeota archaeon]